MNTFKLFITACALTFVGAKASADEVMSSDHATMDSGYSELMYQPGRGRRPPPRPPGGGYRYHWQYAGQVDAPIHGSPAVHGINYCGTEYPGQCYYYGQLCYVNNGYWWDNSRQCNWFNYYRCQ